MDKFVVILMDESGTFYGSYASKQAKTALAKADDAVQELAPFVMGLHCYTNIPQEAMWEYDHKGKVSLRHKPQRDLRRV